MNRGDILIEKTTKAIASSHDKGFIQRKRAVAADNTRKRVKSSIGQFESQPELSRRQ